MSSIRIKKNLFLSILAQMISLVVSLILSLIVPKYIDEYQYAYWQTFVLYVGYVGGLHFGLLDGIVLKYSQYDYDELDKPKIRSQFRILVCSISTLALILCSVGFIFAKGNTRTIIFLVAVGIITKQLTGYSSYMFQITNRINKYALLTVIQRMSYGLLVICLLFSKIHAFYFLCLAELIGDIIGFCITAKYNKEVFWGKSIPAKEAFLEWKTNVSAGLILMLANWSSMLIIGSAKMIVQWHWDELVFGKFSFAFSVSNLFLSFVTAISVVLFPSLKRMKQEELPILYRELRGSVTLILFTAMLFYYPVSWILSIYLPQYQQSLVYLGAMLPMVIYSSRIGLLTNNYLKAYRKEKQMLIVNILAVITAILFYLFGAYLLDNITAILISIVIVTTLKSIISEIYVSKEIGLQFAREYLVEFVMTVLFVVFTMTMDRLQGFGCYCVSLIVYYLINKDFVLELLNKLAIKPKHS